jgi:RNA polymerase sigma-70 factor (ECF subfamily)
MTQTSASLLDRLKGATATDPEWRRLQDLYLPLIQTWLARIPGVREESEDLAQEVLMVMIRELPVFQPRGPGSFRAWLRMIAVNQTRAYFKRRRRHPVTGTEGLLAQLEDSNSELSRQWDQEHNRHLSQRLLQMVKPDFTEATWQAFTRFALEGRPAASVAAELEMSENAVLLAKSRVLKRLREEAGAFLT